MLLSSRCEMRPPIDADGEELIRLWTDPTVRVFLGGSLSKDEAAARVSDLLSTRENVWVVTLIGARAREPVIGLVALHSHHDGEDVEISYSFLPEFTGQGLAAEAVDRILQHALFHMGLQSLVAEAQAANLPSCRMLERIGFACVGETQRFGAYQRIYRFPVPPAASSVDI
ncbi:GNAT family N-acetyltransferase [Rhizobium rhizosphaerae]|uniref:GNAT family N-acetyltransferase n=1 Tax=Xaviernesmea rhizosphaerae TaxID=1672749 RepID=UPI00094FA077|nr:GNAT family N-acetyltransferase [Xaviernesmea rhizosphaerae]